MAAVQLSALDAERLRAFERRGHDLVSASYADFFALITALATRPLLDAVSIRPAMRLLDVATGPGSVAAAAASRGAQAVGVDLAPKMVELARRRHPGIVFQEADVEHLPFPDDSFDALVCSFGLGHFPCPDAAVAECRRVLKGGGRLAFAWWDDPSRQRVQGLFREAIAEVGIPPAADLPSGHTSLRFCDRDEFLRLLHEAGLADVTLEGHTTTYRFVSTDALWQGGLSSMALTGAAIRAQDAATQERVRAAFVRRALAYQSDAGLDVPIAFRIGAGRKPG